MKALLLIPCIIAPAYGEDAGYERIKELLQWSPLLWTNRGKELKAIVIKLIPDENGKPRVSKAEQQKVINRLIPKRDRDEILDICHNNSVAKDKIREYIENKMYDLFWADPVIEEGSASRIITNKLIPKWP